MPNALVDESKDARLHLGDGSFRVSETIKEIIMSHKPSNVSMNDRNAWANVCLAVFELTIRGDLKGLHCLIGRLIGADRTSVSPSDICRVHGLTARCTHCGGEVNFALVKK